MVTPAPLIAVAGRSVETGRIRGWASAALAAPRPYLEALARAGARSAVLPPVSLDAGAAADLLGRFDGLVLLGGGDLDPSTYGAPRHERVYGVDGVSDAFELALVRAALDVELPVLAICRGLQVLNVACGGTLDQHITGREGLLAHGVPGEPGGAVEHEVEIEPGSRLARAMGVTRAVCSSHHHQAVAVVGEGLTVVARSRDGVVEGLEHERGWAVGVQWHPEDTAATDPVQQRLFDAFIHRVCTSVGAMRQQTCTHE